MPVLRRQFDDVEPALPHHDYRIKDLVERFAAKLSEKPRWNASTAGLMQAHLQITQANTFCHLQLFRAGSSVDRKHARFRMQIDTTSCRAGTTN
jgi:hypothetical protein